MNAELKDYFTEEQEFNEPKKKQLRQTKVLVEEILSRSDKARNSDKVLIDEYCYEITGKRIDPDILALIGSFESITRCRRKLNEEGLYLSDDKIAMERANNEMQVREWSKE